jgi:kynurenine formamidase
VTAIPNEDEVLAYFDKLSNWGRWGADDVLGTLNLITDAKRLEASQLVRFGRTVSCAWDIGTGLQDDDVAGPPQRYMITTGQGLGDEHRLLPTGLLPTDRQAGVSEFLGLVYHGFRVTHLDALSHIFWDSKMYNGVPAELVSSSFGATAHDVTNVRNAILTRGVLLDVPRHRGVPWLEPGEYVTADEIDSILKATGTEVRAGDALLLRTGYGARREQNGPDNVHHAGRAGWHANCLPWFHGHDVALISADTATDVIPSGYDNVRIPIHAIGITAMGLWLLDNCNLEALAATCAELGTWEFEYIVAPLPFTGATGSPVNPLAVF